MFSEDDDDADESDNDEARWININNNNKREKSDDEDAAIEEIYNQTKKRRVQRKVVATIPQVKDFLTNIPNLVKKKTTSNKAKLQNTVPCMAHYLRSMLAIYHQDVFQPNVFQKVSPQLKNFLHDLRLHVTRNPHLEATLGVEAAQRLLHQLDERASRNDNDDDINDAPLTSATTTTTTTSSAEMPITVSTTILATARTAPAASNPYQKSRATTTAPTAAVSLEPPREVSSEIPPLTMESNSLKHGRETQDMMTEDEDEGNEEEEVATIMPTMMTCLTGPTQLSP